jgi:hypothetical protein
VEKQRAPQGPKKICVEFKLSLTSPPMPRLYDHGTHVSMDPCALETRERENAAISEYRTFNAAQPSSDIRVCQAKRERLLNQFADSPNLRYQEGVGSVPLPCLIDTDTKLRHLPSWTQTRERVPLKTRYFSRGPRPVAWRAGPQHRILSEKRTGHHAGAPVRSADRARFQALCHASQHLRHQAV